MKRRPRLVQHIPEGPQATFALVQTVQGATYWRFVLTDNASGSGFWTDLDTSAAGQVASNRPEYRYAPPKKGCPFTLTELVTTAALKLAEGRGWLTAEEIVDGWCLFAGVWVANGMWVFCLWSTDAQRAPPTTPAEMVARAKAAIEEARRARERLRDRSQKPWHGPREERAT